MSQTQKAEDSCMTPVTQSQYLPSPCYHQMCLTPIHCNNLTQILLPTVEQYLFPHPVPHTSLYTTFSSPCTSDTHHCTQHFPHPLPQTHITVHNISLTLYLRHNTVHKISFNLYLRHTSLYTTFPSLCTSDTHHCTPAYCTYPVCYCIKTTVKIYLMMLVIESEIARWRPRIYVLFEFRVTKIIDGWELPCKFYTEIY